MKLTKRSLSMIVAIVLCAVTAIGGTFAYLTDQTEEVQNVMTVGNVKISQDENFDSDTAVLYPEKKVTKEVTVTNEGHTPAYVRTLVSFDMGTMSAEEVAQYIQYSYTEADWIKGTPYVDTNTGKYVVPFIYKKALPAGATTSPSLTAVWLDGSAGNEELEKLATNGKYIISVLSQAVQTEGFSDATTALAVAFDGATPPTSATPDNWIEKLKAGESVSLSSGTYTLTESVTGAGTIVIPSGATVTLDLSDNTLTTNQGTNAHTITVGVNSNVTIKDGTVANTVNAGVVNNGGKLTLENCTITNENGSSYALVLHSGITTMTNCTVNSLRGGIGIAEGAKLTATGGSVTARDYYPLYMTGGTADFDNTSFVRENQSKARYMIYNSGNVTAEFDNCSFTSKRPATNEQTKLANASTGLTFTNCTYDRVDTTK